LPSRFPPIRQLPAQRLDEQAASATHETGQHAVFALVPHKLMEKEAGRARIVQTCNPLNRIICEGLLRARLRVREGYKPNMPAEFKYRCAGPEIRPRTSAKNVIPKNDERGDLSERRLQGSPPGTSQPQVLQR
jgi:hypothetical protein